MLSLESSLSSLVQVRCSDRSEVAGAPAFRVCPRCASVIEYESQCKHMTCRCGHSFCWLCTKDAGQHAASGDLDWNINFSCPIAPVQSEEEIRQILSRQR
ncbi:ARI4 [Symbiodinium natans]|uniref:ARI4 protein n=1 Tax=Symbiodinium natans TaxID=878477 RepID=A0A812J333_9DINO|nr:ARI4 [Symbiodinium natans]